MIYVDNYNAKLGNMIMCHMIADTQEELHQMAKDIGIKRKWFQDKKIPHYDISKTKRKLAISKGAQEITTRELILRSRPCECCGKQSNDDTKGSAFCGGCDGGFCKGKHD